MHIEIMLTAIDLYDETLLETDEIDDMGRRAELVGGSGIRALARSADEPAT